MTASQATAGGLVPAVSEEEPIVIVEEERNNSYIVPLLLLGLLAIAASSSESSSDTGGTTDGGGLIEFSDMRLKSDIVQVDTAENGLPIYNFRYKWSPTVYRGVMAQDVLLHTPSAVKTRFGGFLAVDYEALGLEMTVAE